MSKSYQVVFLYTELAEYFLSSVRWLLEHHPVEVHIVRWPVHPDAPFNFDIPEGAKIYERSDYTHSELLKVISNINPDLIYCSGWVDKGYLRVCRNFKKNIPVLMGMDNHWEGSFKQILASLAGRYFLSFHFTHAFVPGKPQKKYAEKLGFPETRIIEGFYSADYETFHGAYLDSHRQKKIKLPHRFLFVGRYIERKGIRELWDAFRALHGYIENDWELWCVGTGPEEKNKSDYNKIVHHGFLQPEELKTLIPKTSVFILPSHYEPWGVVVHEFAAAGFPLICSDKIGAATKFLHEGINGYHFESGNSNDLMCQMAKFVEMPDQEIYNKGKKSAEIAEAITPARWSKKMMEIIKN